jgi:uncharacterized protein YkwD
MRKITLDFYIFLGILFLTCTCNNGDETPEEALRREMLAAINDIRTTGCLCGEDSMPPVQPVVWSDELTIASKRHVDDMSANDFLSHTGSDGSTPANRANDAGFMGAYIGENIARGFISISDVMVRWKTSTSHCKMMMDVHFNFVGAANNSYYWVQVFGSN